MSARAKSTTRGGATSTRERAAVLVLGMHRSGTSALTRLLSLLGLDLPATIVDPLAAKPNDSNRESGFWESDVLRVLHDEVLSAAGLGWDTPRLLPESWYASPAGREAGARIRDAVSSEYGAATLFVVKDPRMCRLVPPWREALDILGISPRCVVIVRNPLEVAGSLAARDGMSVERSVLLWLIHSIEAERHTRGCRRVFVAYDRVLEDWRRECARIGSVLGLAFPRPFADAASDVECFLRSDRRHHRATREGLVDHPGVAAAVVAAYDLLLAAAERDVVDESGLDAVRRHLTLAEELFGSLLGDGGAATDGSSGQDLAAPLVARAEVRLAATIRALEERLGRWEGDLERSWREIVHVRRAAEETRSRAQGTEYHLNRLEDVLAADRESMQRQINVLGEGSQWLSDMHRMTVDRIDRLAAGHRALEGRFRQLGSDLERERDLRALGDQSLSRRVLRGVPAPLDDGPVRRRSPYRWWGLVRALPRWARGPGVRTGIRRWLACREIERRDAFDVGYYLARNPDVAGSDVDPLYHWVAVGAGEGRDPSPAFDLRFYLEQHPEAAAGGLNPLLHYLRTGARLGYPTRPPDGASPPVPNASTQDRETVASAEERVPDTPAPGSGVPAAAAPGGAAPSGTVPGGPPGDRDPAVAPATPPAAFGTTAVSAARGDATRVPCRWSHVARDIDTSDPRVRLIAFYLPQFHTIPENDRWWGEGFTEWTNVTRAQPLFAGHVQPVLPRDLGFYDLRIADNLRRQAALAREHGIFGFCIYVYWFSGRRLLETPLANLREDPSIAMPFCICWANENWTRAWDGEETAVLIGQDHSFESDARFLAEHLDVLADPRYIRVDGRPVVVVYRADLLAEPKRTAERWRGLAREAGFPDLHLCAVGWKVGDPRALGFDAIVEFPPHSLEQIDITGRFTAFAPDFSGLVLDYEEAVARVGTRSHEGFPVYRGVMPAWDNTPRRGRTARVFWGASPELYRSWLTRMVEETVERPPGTARMVFVNSWNEWAEGAMLEPSSLHGRAYLEATRAVLASHGGIVELPRWSWKDGRPPAAGDRRHPLLVVSHDAARAGGQLTLLDTIRGIAGTGDFEVFIVLCEGGVLEDEFGRLGHVVNLGGVRHDDELVTRMIEDLRSDGLDRDFLLAICNTITTSHVARSCQVAGVPVLSLVWELPTSIRDAFGAERIEQVVSCSRRIVVASEFARDQLAGSFGLPRDLFVPLHIGFAGDLDRVAGRDDARRRVLRELDLADEAFLVLGCGTIHHRKGTDLFVQVAREVRGLPGAERMVFLWLGADQCGPTFREWCLHDAATAGVSEVVRFVGEVATTADYFAAADAFLLTSREDPFPRVVLEAMAHATPVVAFLHGGGAAEVLGDGCGLVVPYLDVREMARGLSRLCEAPRFAEEMRARIRRRMETDYSWARFTEDLLAILERDFGYARSASVPGAGPGGTTGP